MVRRLWKTALDKAGALALDELPDADLVARFLADRAGPAFAAVVRRHGPLVWGVCRNLLPAEADAEDAFQATFLALANGAGRLRNPNALGAWLHAVAGRACRMARRAAARRNRRERAAAVREAHEPVPADAWDRWQAVVHEEVDCLPKPLREAFVLCVLQGVRQPDAARRLGWSLGTVSGRVCQAKKRLVAALGRRGLTGAAGAAALLGGGATAGPVTAGLTSRAAAVVAGGPVSEIVHQLARGATGGLMGKTKLLAAGLLAAGLAVGTGLIPSAGGQVPAAPARGGPPSAGAPTTQPPAAGSPDLAPRAPSTAPTARPGSKVEYKFVPPPAETQAAMDLLTKLGADGWEYVGPLPAGGERLVFKRFAMTQPVAEPTTGTAPAPAPRPGRGSPPADRVPWPRPAGLRPAPETAPGGPTRPADITDPFAPPPGQDPVRDDPDPDGPASGVGNRPADPPFGRPAPGKADLDSLVPTPLIELAARETVRHRMRTGAVIDRIKVGGSGVPAAEVTPDPTDAKRVLIKAGDKAGDSRLLLTDANGVQESFTIRVK